MIVMAGRQAQPVFPVGPFYVKELSLFGFAMFNATPDEQRALRRRHQPLAGREEAARADRQDVPAPRPPRRTASWRRTRCTRRAR